jgi:hypothetical protein
MTYSADDGVTSVSVPAIDMLGVVKDYGRTATPLYYYGAGLPLVQGIDRAHVALLGISVLFAMLTPRTFGQRDVTTGGATDLDAAAVLRRMLARSSGV